MPGMLAGRLVSNPVFSKSGNIVAILDWANKKDLSIYRLSP